MCDMGRKGRERAERRGRRESGKEERDGEEDKGVRAS